MTTVIGSVRPVASEGDLVPPPVTVSVSPGCGLVWLGAAAFDPDGADALARLLVDCAASVRAAERRVPRREPAP